MNPLWASSVGEAEGHTCRVDAYIQIGPTESQLLECECYSIGLPLVHTSPVHHGFWPMLADNKTQLCSFNLRIQ